MSISNVSTSTSRPENTNISLKFRLEVSCSDSFSEISVIPTVFFKVVYSKEASLLYQPCITCFVNKSNLQENLSKLSLT